jgi:glutamate formiminotransferase
MPFPLEAVPNFSEGRDETTVRAIAEALGDRAALLDVHFDADHNRSVFTLAGGERELVEALVEGVRVARKLIDLRRHEGVHPCVGVADVVPIVAVRPEDMERARACALELARQIGVDLGLPVFLYGELAWGRRLPELRRGGPEELARRMESGELVPDFGSATLDLRTGAVLVGARAPLVAFNVNLRGDIAAAKEIAGLVREESGGFTGVRALGLELRGAGAVQVSMNIEDWQKSGLAEIFTRIEQEAARLGVEVAGSELVGLIPLGAAAEAEQAGLFFAPAQILESRLGSELGEELDDTLG